MGLTQRFPVRAIGIRAGTRTRRHVRSDNVTTVSDPQTSKVVPLFQTLAWRVEAADPSRHRDPRLHQWLDQPRPHLFDWTKTADEILKKANRQTTSNAGR